MDFTLSVLRELFISLLTEGYTFNTVNDFTAGPTAGGREAPGITS